MRFIEVSEYGEKQFVLLTGIKREVFEMMVEVISQSNKNFGRRRTLSADDEVLLCLSYWREYRSQFHLSQFHLSSSFGVSESTVCRTIQKVEGALLKDERFHLPGKKALHDRFPGTYCDCGGRQ